MQSQWKSLKKKKPAWMVPKVNQRPIRKSCLVVDKLVRMKEQQIRPENELSPFSPDDKRRPYLASLVLCGEH